ncbi:MAG: glycosyltransferase family 1 protein [Clostridiaceae bacterium]
MKVCIDARGLNWYKGTGIGTYTNNLIKNILKLNYEIDYHLFWSGNGYNSLKNNNVKILMASKKYESFFEKYYIPSYIKNREIDIYHVPQNGIGLMENIKCTKIVTIHDLIPYVLPETVGRGYLKRFLTDMPKIIENSEGIVTVSQYSKNDILKFFPSFPEDDIFVTPLAADDIFKPLDKIYCKKFLKNLYNIELPYFLYLGGFSLRKNVRSLILAFEKALPSFNNATSLVIAGMLKEEGEILKTLVEERNLGKYIKFIGFCPLETLPALYNNCEAFVYPSIYEGFGLPPLEAMSCKVPVITSNTTSISEVAGDSALYTDPSDFLSIAEALVKVRNDESLRIQLSEKAYQRSRNFSWKKTAEATLKAYRKIYEKYLCDKKLPLG